MIKTMPMNESANKVKNLNKIPRTKRTHPVWEKLKKEGELGWCYTIRHTGLPCGNRFWVYWLNENKPDGSKRVMTQCAPCFFRRK